MLKGAGRGQAAPRTVRVASLKGQDYRQWASGPALPVEETGSGANAGLVTFTWNQPTTVQAPPASQTYNGS